MDFTANEIVMAIYSWRKEKPPGDFIASNYETRKFSEKLVAMIYQANSDEVLSIILWIQKSADFLLKKADSSPDNTLILINFQIPNFITAEEEMDFNEMIKRIMTPMFRKKYQEFHIIRTNKIIEAIAYYLSMNLYSLRLTSDYMNVAMLHFGTNSLTIGYPMNEALMKDPNLFAETYLYELEYKEMPIYVHVNKCYGLRNMFLYMYSKDFDSSSLNETLIVESPCLPIFKAITKNDFRRYDLDVTCYKEMLDVKHLLIQGTGKPDECKSQLNSFLDRKLCKPDEPPSSECFLVPKLFPTDLTLAIPTQIKVLTMNVIKLFDMKLNARSFPDEYRRAKNYFCQTDIRPNASLFEKMKFDDYEESCWRMVYIEVILERFGYRLEDWRNIKFFFGFDSLTRGLATLEADSRVKMFVFDLIAEKTYFYFFFTFLMTQLYFIGISTLYETFPRMARTRRIFSIHYNRMIGFKLGDPSVKRTASDNTYLI